jgi:uroporphyrinogen III methyltransferase / synthase
MHKDGLVALTNTDAENLPEQIKRIGGRVIALPVTKIKEQKLSAAAKAALRELAKYDWIIFTSKHAVQFFIKALWDGRIKLPAPVKMPRIAAVGPGTARAAARAHLRVDVTPKRFSGTDLVVKLGTMKKALSGKRILFPRSAIAPKETIEALRGQGAQVTLLPLYTVVTAKVPARLMAPVEKSAVDYVIFLSPSGINGFIKNVRNKKLALAIPAICIGPTSAAAARTAGFKKIHTAKKATAAGIVDLLRKLP